MQLRERSTKEKRAYLVTIKDNKCIIRRTRPPCFEVLYDPETKTGKIINYKDLHGDMRNEGYAKFKTALKKAIAFANYNIITDDRKEEE
jgi:hypothetical protein